MLDWPHSKPNEKRPKLLPLRWRQQEPSQAKNTARSQIENERASEADGQQEGLNHTSNPINASTPTSTDQIVPGTRSTPPEAQTRPPEADQPKVAPMEEEMRLMVEKMREYQTQDPQLFAHVWDSIKKTQVARPIQAQMRAGGDLIKALIDSQNK
jgi:hypothetical protein